MKNQTAAQNAETAARLAAHLGELVEDIRFEELRSNAGGEALYAVTCYSGEIRYCIEGSTGELKGNWESEADALADWNM